MNESDLMKVRQAAGAAGAGNELKAAIARAVLLQEKELRELRAQVERLTGGRPADPTVAELSVLDSPRRLDALALRLEVLERELGVGGVEVDLEEAPAERVLHEGDAVELVGPKGPHEDAVMAASVSGPAAPQEAKGERGTWKQIPGAGEEAPPADPISEQRTAIAFPEPPTEKRSKRR